MKSRNLIVIPVAVIVLWTVGSEAAQPAYSYTTTVQLADGKMLSCAVNESAGAMRGASERLNRSEQTEADVLATQRLRLLSGPTSDYPSPYTAPKVMCKAAG